MRILITRRSSVNRQLPQPKKPGNRGFSRLLKKLPSGSFLRFWGFVSTVEARGVWLERMLPQVCPRRDYGRLRSFRVSATNPFALTEWHPSRLHLHLNAGKAYYKELAFWQVLVLLRKKG